MSYSWLLHTNADENQLAFCNEQLQRKGFAVSNDGKRLESKYVYILSSLLRAPIQQRSMEINARFELFAWKWNRCSNNEDIDEIHDVCIYLFSLLGQGLFFEGGDFLSVMKYRDQPMVLNSYNEEVQDYILLCEKYNLRYELSNLGF